MRADLRLASSRDAAALARISREALAEGWSEAAIRASLERDGVCALVSEPLRGFAIGSLAGDEAEILTLAVEKGARGRGLGRALVVALLERLRAQGARCVSLEVRSRNAPAIALYRSLGFAHAGVRPRYYRDGEDALVLGAAL